MFLPAIRPRLRHAAIAVAALVSLGALAGTAQGTTGQQQGGNRLVYDTVVIAVDSHGNDVRTTVMRRKCKTVRIRTKANGATRSVTARKCKPVKPKPAPAPAPEPTATPPAGTFAGDPNAYTFLTMAEDGKTPGHWNRCAPVRYAVNLTSLPDEQALADIQTAVGMLSAASGLTFTYVGDTMVVALGSDWNDSLRDGPADLYISYADETTVPALAGEVAGLGGPMSIGTPGREPQIVLGGVAFDTAWKGEPGFSAGHRGTLMLHELAHALNLGHTTDRAQIMFPSMDSTSPVDYQAGDRAGLSLLAAQPCFG